MVLIRQTRKNIRVKELGILKATCKYCSQSTEQTIYLNQPLNWFVILIIPVPYPSPRWDIIINCKKCNNIINVLKGKERDSMSNKYKDVNNSFYKRDFMVQIECCDVCFFERNKKIVPSKWRTTYSNMFINVCDKHKDWVKEQKFKDAKEILNRINSWYNKQ